MMLWRKKIKKDDQTTTALKEAANRQSEAAKRLVDELKRLEKPMSERARRLKDVN